MMSSIIPALADVVATKNYSEIAYPCKWILILLNYIWVDYNNESNLWLPDFTK